MARITRRYAGQNGIPGNEWYPHLEDGIYVLGIGDHEAAKANAIKVATELEAIGLIRTHRASIRMTANGIGSGNLIGPEGVLIDGAPA